MLINYTGPFIPEKRKAKIEQYYVYQDSGGTMTMQEWEADGRYDKSCETDFEVFQKDAVE